MGPNLLLVALVGSRAALAVAQVRVRGGHGGGQGGAGRVEGRLRKASQAGEAADARRD